MLTSSRNTAGLLDLVHCSSRNRSFVFFPPLSTRWSCLAMSCAALGVDGCQTILWFVLIYRNTTVTLCVLLRLDQISRRTPPPPTNPSQILRIPPMLSQLLLRHFVEFVIYDEHLKATREVVNALAPRWWYVSMWHDKHWNSLTY